MCGRSQKCLPYLLKFHLRPTLNSPSASHKSKFKPCIWFYSTSKKIAKAFTTRIIKLTFASTGVEEPQPTEQIEKRSQVQDCSSLRHLQLLFSASERHHGHRHSNLDYSWWIMRCLFACRGVFQCTDADDSRNSFLDNCFQHVRRCLVNDDGELNLI